MYNSKIIAAFIEKVNEEAENAANEVFKKYESEFKAKVLAQMKKGDRMYLVNGSGFFKNGNETEAMDKFIDVVAHIQYLEQNASFNTYDFEK